LALWLTRLGVGVRIIDKAAEPGTTPRALASSPVFVVQEPRDELSIEACDLAVEDQRRGHIVCTTSVSTYEI